VVSELREKILEKQIADFVRWLLEERQIGKATAVMYGRMIRNLLKKYDTLIPTDAQVKEYRDAFFAKGSKANYVANIVKAIRNYGKFIGVPLKPKYPPETHEEMPDYITEHELKQMLFACSNSRDQAIIQIMALCGLRPCEVVRLRINDLDFDRGIVKVNTTKTKSVWEIPMPKELMDALNHYTSIERRKDVESDVLFLNQFGNPRSENTHCINRLVQRIAKKAGINKRVHAYTLRHTFATLLTLNGCPLPYTQRLMRHRTFKTTLRYAHIVEQSLNDVYQRYAPLQTAPPNQYQEPSLLEHKSLSPNPQFQRYEPRQSDFDNTRIGYRKCSIPNGYS